MDNHSAQLDAVFRALADPTRRAVLRHLAAGEATVSDLAQPHAMALPSFLKHLGVLEASGLVRTRKVGRVRWVAAEAERLDTAREWIHDLQRSWASRLDRLEAWLDATDPGDPDAP